MKKLLLITYHFPPSAASGAFRMLGFARHLPSFGWQPIVVAPPTLPWEPIDPDLVKQIPAETIVHQVNYPSRAPKILRVLAQDAIWLPRAWFACKRAISRHQPDAILTSGPPHCVHLLGRRLKRWSGLPWVADFRDPWISDGTNRSLSWQDRWNRRWERSVFAQADLILANAPNACRLYQEAFPQESAKIVTLTNGFDPRPERAVARHRTNSDLRLLHAGELYAGRNPVPLLEALTAPVAGMPGQRLHLLGRIETNAFPSLVRERGWSDHVIFEGQRNYEDTLDAMQQADILVLFDTPGRRIGVPAKLYEYLGAGRPILALAESDGDTAAVLRESGVLHRIASPSDAGTIRQALFELAHAIDSDVSAGDSTQRLRFTRGHLTGMLARRLNSLVGQPSLSSIRIDEERAPARDALQEVER